MNLNIINKKSLFAIIITTLLFSLSFVYGEENIAKPSKEYYVADYGNVLNDETKNLIISTNKQYKKTSEKPQVVVVTLTDIKDIDIESYSVKLFEEWKIGNKDYDNGVLLLLSLNEKKIKIEVGYGLEGALTDGKSGEILDSISKLLKEAKYSKAVEKAFIQITDEVNTEYEFENIETVKITASENKENISEKVKKKFNLPIWAIVLIAIGVVILILLDQIFLGGILTAILIKQVIRRILDDEDEDDDYGGGGISGGGGSSRSF